jgi:glycerophosphoryl diester phosphodiesterase
MKNNTILLENKGTVKMVAHRGISGLERENTCPAFLAAGMRSYFGIETDVHITRDGNFILCHDSNLSRVAGVDMVIEESDFDALRSVHFTDIWRDMPRNDIFLPSLEEYLHICLKYEKEAVLEVKGSFTPEECKRLVEAVRAAEMLEHTTFISFSKESCIGVKNACADAKIQFLFLKDPDEGIDFCIEHGFDADMYRILITPERIERLHAASLEVNCWTVNDPKEAEALISMGIDYITSNILE